jgi:hypothetical protein
MVTLLAFLAYTLFVFDGGGRLTVAALGFVIGIMASWRLPNRLVKVAVLLATVPVLIVFSDVGQSRIEYSLSPTVPETTGLESVVRPVQNLGRLLELESEARLQHQAGATFVASATGLVPRSLWPDKPIGLGALLVSILAPQFMGTNLSLAALYQAEWLMNFGYLGLMFMIPLLGWLVSALDRRVWRAFSQNPSRRTAILGILAGTIAIAGLGDLVWVGSFTYATRAGARLFILACIATIVWLAEASTRRSSLPAGK